MKRKTSLPLDWSASRYYFLKKVLEPQMESAITVKGQATIPKAIRDHLHLRPGDRVKFFVHPDGTVVLLPKRPASVLRGFLKSGRNVTLEEMDAAVARRTVERATRRKRR